MAVALFVTELIPGLHRSGQESYNATIVAAAEAAGFEVRYLITGRRADLLNLRSPLIERDVARFLHFQKVAGRLIPTTLAAVLRSMKRWLQTFSSGMASREQSVLGGVAPIGRYLSQRERARVLAFLQRIQPDLVIVDTIFREYVGSDCSNRTKPPRLLVMHDVFHTRCRSFGRNGFMPQPFVTEKLEAEAWQAFDGLIAINHLEARLAQALVGRQPVITILPTFTGLNASFPMCRAKDNEVHGVLFLGTASPHNRDALGWFVANCWAEAMARHPAAVLHVVGTVGTEFANVPGLVVHGAVDDIRHIAASCSVAINPAQMGSGLKIKMLDYLQQGLPVVSTSVGSEGYPRGLLQPFKVVDKAACFAKMTARLLADAEMRLELVERIPDYLSGFDPNIAATAFRTLVEAVSDKKHSPK